jgi:hypothetical protein
LIGTTKVDGSSPPADVPAAQAPTAAPPTEQSRPALRTAVEELPRRAQ